MTALQIDLDWFRCPDGYRIVNSRDLARELKEEPRSYPNETWIVPNSTKRVPYRPLDKNDMICVAFSRLTTAESLLAFIRAYGPLIRSSPEWGDSVAGCLGTARRFYELLACSEKGPSAVSSAFRAQERRTTILSHKISGASMPEDYDFGILNRMIGTADIIADPRRGIRVRVTTEVLIGGLWWQLVLKIGGATNFRICRHCSVPFEAGPGTGKHIDANFCCNEHKMRYFSLARSSRRSKN